MNHVDCVIKRDVYPQKMHSCSKTIRTISVFVLKISVAYKNYIPGIFLAEIQASHASEIQHGKKIHIYTQ